MSRLLTVLVLILLGPATFAVGAAGLLLGGTRSVHESEFCRAHGCTFFSSGLIPAIPDTGTFDFKAYEYTLASGARLSAGRMPDMTLFMADLSLGAAGLDRPGAGRLVADFTRTFAGVTFEPRLLAACAARAKRTGGSSLARGKLPNGEPYSVTCMHDARRGLVIGLYDEWYAPR